MSGRQMATANFEKWLTDHGVSVSSKVKITEIPNQGRGLIATSDIKKDEVLFSVPRAATLYLDNCSLTTDKPELKEKLGHLNQWESLIIVLFYELKVKGKDSKWAPYFDILPVTETGAQVLNQLIFWNNDELEYLKPSLILERVGKDTTEAMYHNLCPGLMNELGLPELASVTLEDYLKVGTLIKSYSFDVDKEIREEEGDDDENESEDEEKEGDEDEHGKRSGPRVIDESYYKTMIPLADILNADTNLHNTSLTYTDNGLSMMAIKDIKNGEQIYNTYSDHPNSEILRRYGYVEIQGSKYDFGEIPLSTIKRHFSKYRHMPKKEITEVLRMLNVVMIHEEEEGGEYTEIVLDSYDCFKTYDVLMELIFVIQFLTIVTTIHNLNSVESLTHEAKFQLVQRIFKKCYQLIESKKLTEQFLVDYNMIISDRLAEYPPLAAEPFLSEYPKDRRALAAVVLKSEYIALKNCSESNKVFAVLGGYNFIKDGKLISNIVKKNFNVDSNSDEEPQAKKQRKR